MAKVRLTDEQVRLITVITNREGEIPKFVAYGGFSIRTVESLLNKGLITETQKPHPHSGGYFVLTEAGKEA